jgi:hypothetical protein
MSIVFYPILGVDIIAPLMVVENTNKIYSLGPVPGERFEGKGGKVEKTMRYISKLMEFGDNRFDAKERDEIVEFFPDIGEKIKSYNFKRRKMWLSQFRTHDQKSVSLYYFYTARTTDSKLPFTEKIDFLVHKDYELTQQLLQNLKSICKPDTKLVAPAKELHLYWKVPKSVIEDLEPIDTYDINKDRDQDLYIVDLNKYLNMIQ